jgi:hypothetical protein
MHGKEYRPARPRRLEPSGSGTPRKEERRCMTRLRQRISEAVALDVTGHSVSALDRFPRPRPHERPKTTSTCARSNSRCVTRSASSSRPTQASEVRTSSTTASHPKSVKPQGRHKLSNVRGRAGRKRVSNVEAGSSGGLAAPDSAARASERCRGQNLKRGVRFARRRERGIAKQAIQPHERESDRRC